MKFQEIIKRIKERKAGVVIAIMSLLLMPFSCSAQDFSVASFRLLPNDVSAFIDHPIRNCETQGRSGRNMALSTQRYEDANLETPGMGSNQRLQVGQAIRESYDLRVETQPPQTYYHRSSRHHRRSKDRDRHDNNTTN